MEIFIQTQKTWTPAPKIQTLFLKVPSQSRKTSTLSQKMGMPALKIWTLRQKKLNHPFWGSQTRIPKIWIPCLQVSTLIPMSLARCPWFWTQAMTASARLPLMWVPFPLASLPPLKSWRRAQRCFPPPPAPLAPSPALIVGEPSVAAPG